MSRTVTEQDKLEFKARLRAEFAFQQKVERLRWERDTLIPAVAEFEKQVAEGASIKTLLPGEAA